MSTEAGNRYAVITPDNQSANIWVCALISVTLGAACLIGRMLFRFRLGFAFANDDYVFCSAWVVQVIQVGLLLKGTAMGLGQSQSIIDPNNFSSIQSYTAASTVMTIFALFIVKVSMVMLIGRLFTKTTRIYWIAVGVLGVIATIQIEAGCMYPTCTNIRPRYIVYAVFDIVTELLIVALPVYYIQDVRMKPKRKAKVLTTFSSRTLVIIFSGLIIWAATRVDETGEYSTSIALLVVLLQCQLGLSLIICAVIPCFRMIFQSSDMIITSSAEISRETKRGPNNEGSGSHTLRSYGANPVSVAQTDTQISYVRQATPPPPPITRKPQQSPQHRPQSSEDTTAAGSDFTRRPSEGRASESSLVPSGTTGLSSKPLVQAPVL